MSAFITIDEIVEDACHAMDDYLLRNKMKFLRFAKRVYNDDLKLGSVRAAVRQFFEIDKRTNTIKMPCDFHRLSGVYWKDRNGRFHPMYRNDRLNDDIVDIKAKKDCACDCGGKLCNAIKSYESIVEEIEETMPDDSTQTFRCETRKGVDGNGWYYEVVQYPIRIFEDGVWVNTEVKTEKRDLCQLEMEGECVVDCDANVEAVYGCSCSDGNTIVSCPAKMDSYMTECGTWVSEQGFKNVFNITEEGDRLIFPNDIPIDKVLIRYYPVVDLRNIKVPLVARSCMITGILFENFRFKTDRESILAAREFGQRFTNESFALLGELNRYNAAAKNAIMSPVAYFP